VLDADDAELQKVAQCDSDVEWAAVVNRGIDVAATANIENEDPAPRASSIFELD
jgi:hypothetical protein